MDSNWLYLRTKDSSRSSGFREGCCHCCCPTDDSYAEKDVHAMVGRDLLLLCKRGKLPTSRAKEADLSLSAHAGCWCYFFYSFFFSSCFNDLLFYPELKDMVLDGRIFSRHTALLLLLHGNLVIVYWSASRLYNKHPV